MAHGLPIFQPEKISGTEPLNMLRELQPELVVVVAYGHILPREILQMPPLGCINVHASLLPRWRGAAPIQWAILSGDTETGVTTMLMDEGLDTGHILLQERIPISANDTAATLRATLATMGARLLVQTVEKLQRGELKPQPQDNARATFARKLRKEDGRIDWGEAATQICRKVRAFDPWPGAFSSWTSGDSKRTRLIRIWSAAPLPEDTMKRNEPTRHKPGEILTVAADSITVAAGIGAVRITELQLEGRKRMRAGDFLRGHPITVGTTLA